VKQPELRLRTVTGTVVLVAGHTGGMVTTPAGTVTTMEDPSEAADVTVATTPPNRTSASAVLVGRFTPLIVTEVPAGPDAGKKLVIVIADEM
jgi:hypothetical protein